MNNSLNENIIDSYGSSTITGYYMLDNVFLIVGIVTILISLILYRKKTTNMLIISSYITIACLIKCFIRRFDGSTLRVEFVVIYLCVQWILSITLYKFMKNKNPKFISIVNCIYSIISIMILYIVMLNMYEPVTFFS